MKIRRKSEKLDRFLKKKVLIILKDETKLIGRLMWSTGSSRESHGIRIGRYYVLTKTGPVEIYKCQVKHIEKYTEKN